MIYCKYILPVFRAFLLLEEDAISSGGSGMSDGNNHNSSIDSKWETINGDGNGAVSGSTGDSNGRNDSNNNITMRTPTTLSLPILTQQQHHHHHQQQQYQRIITNASTSTAYNLIVFMKEPRLLKGFVNASANILGFFEVILKDIESGNMNTIRTLSKYIEYTHG